MTKAALYARVSTDAQQKEGTIASQLVELRRQISAAGHVLVREYIDDGFSGTLLDRPALNQMRADLKTDVFDTIYFLAADRIAREVEYQRIIVGELLKHGKQITINGKDYEQNPENKLTLTMLGAFAEARVVAYQTIIIEELLKCGKQIIIKGQNYADNPENKFTLQMLGAVAEYEHAKIIERTTRGRLHRLRQGELTSTGHRIFGYDYVRKTPTAPCALVINEDQAAVVRSVFEMFASGRYGLVTICRHLEERGILTRMGKSLWDNDRIKAMLKNETYAGTRYFNQTTATKDAIREGKKLIHGRVRRDRTEWIPVKVPAIVSRELFDTVQERLARHNERYCRPQTRYLLSGLIQCGCCGSRGSSSRRWLRVVRRPGRCPSTIRPCTAAFVAPNSNSISRHGSSSRATIL
jgi:site-specific DNA recombinase